MNKNVNISFIPKKPLARDETIRHHKPLLTVSFLISFIIAFVAIGASVMQFIRIEAVEQERMAKIEELKVYNEKLKADDLIKGIEEIRADARKINIVKNLLNQHVATTELFAFLKRTTPKQVSFEDFNFKGSDGVVTLKMKGQAKSYEVLAALSQLYKKEKSILREYTLTNFTLTNTGRVSFNFSGTFDPSLTAYSFSSQVLKF